MLSLQALPAETHLPLAQLSIVRTQSCLQVAHETAQVARQASSLQGALQLSQDVEQVSLQPPQPALQPPRHCLMVPSHASGMQLCRKPNEHANKSALTPIDSVFASSGANLQSLASAATTRGSVQDLGSGPSNLETWLGVAFTREVGAAVATVATLVVGAAVAIAVAIAIALALLAGSGVACTAGAVSFRVQPANNSIVAAHAPIPQSVATKNDLWSGV
jgi:hypothetical protein